MWVRCVGVLLVGSSSRIEQLSHFSGRRHSPETSHTPLPSFVSPTHHTRNIRLGLWFSALIKDKKTPLILLFASSFTLKSLIKKQENHQKALPSLPLRSSEVASSHTPAGRPLKGKVLLFTPPLAALPAMAMPPLPPKLLERLRRAPEDEGGSPPPDDAGPPPPPEGGGAVGVVLLLRGGREGNPEDFARLAWRAYRS